MLRNIGYKHLAVIIVIYFVVIFTGAFVIKTNYSSGIEHNLLFNEFEPEIEESLSFLDDFVVEDVLESPLPVDTNNHDKRIVKRSASSLPVPQYMLDLYERLSDKRFHAKFDTAKSFPVFNVLKDLNDVSNLPGNAIKKDSSIYELIFNVFHFLPSDSALFAQLRLQVRHQESPKIFDLQNIEVYSKLENMPLFLTSKLFDPTKESLFTVDVMDAFQKALKTETKQLHLMISIPDEFDDFFVLDAEPSEGPQLLVLSKTVKKTADGEDKILESMRRSLEEKIPEFSLTGESVSRGRRQRRSEDEDEEAEEQSNYIVEELGRIRKGKLKRKKNPCRRKPLHVSFAAINYDQWIIAPPSYEAFECTGKCSFPMSAHLAPTKHAIIQTLMHSLEPKQVSRACCVPIKLDPISILFVDDDGSVNYKYEYEDMVVTECGCR